MSLRTASRSQQHHKRKHFRWHHHHHHDAGEHQHNWWQHEFESEFQEPLPPVWRCTLYAEEPDHEGKPTIDPVCGLVLASFGEKAWNGRCRATKVEQNMWFDMFDDGDGSLTVKEVQRAMRGSVDLVRDRLPAALHGLLVERLVEAAFTSSRFDRDGSGTMDKDEWNHFLDQLEILYLKYRSELSHQSERAFYGRGWTAMLEDDSDTDESGDSEEEEPVDPAEYEVHLLHKIADRAPTTERAWQQWGVDKDCDSGWIVPPGWWEDFVYYSANHHPLHGIISCDPDHRMSRGERMFMELATIGFLFIAADLKAKLRREDEGGNLDESDLVKHSLNALISLAGIFVYYVMYLLFTCPKLGFVDRSKANEDEARRAEFCEAVGSGVGYTLMAGLGVTLLIQLPMLEKRWRPVLWSRFQGYIFTWVFAVLFPFNPFFAWGNNSSNPKNFEDFCLGDWLGIGQWRIEKQRFQGQCLRLKDKSFEDLTALAEGVFSPTSTATSPTKSPRRRRAASGGLQDSPRSAAADSQGPSPTSPREMEAARGVRRARPERGGIRGRRRAPRPPPRGPGAACRQRPPQAAAREVEGRLSGLSLPEWGEVFSNADAAWRGYVSSSGYRGRKPDRATA